LALAVMLPIAQATQELQRVLLAQEQVLQQAQT
jgi:hypothetical protein